VAAVVEVVVNGKGEIAIPRIDVALDCGPQVNPDRVRSQIEGAWRDGAGNALVSEITFKAGRVEQSNFHDYQVARINVAPRDIRVHLIASSFNAPLGGVGEPGVPPIAPALCNAIFAATGKRIPAPADPRSARCRFRQRRVTDVIVPKQPRHTCGPALLGQPRKEQRSCASRASPGLCLSCSAGPRWRVPRTCPSR